MAYPHKWSPISCKSSAGQRKDTGQRQMLYRWTTQPGGRYGRKIGAQPPFGGGGAGSPSHTMSLALRHTSLPRHFTTTDMGQKLGRGSCPFAGGGAGSPSRTMWRGLRPISMPSGILIHAAIWPQQIWAKNWEGGSAPFLGRGTGSPFKTMWLRHTSMPSFILIHPSVWLQYTNVTDRQDIGRIVQGEPFYKQSPEKVSFYKIL